MLSFLLRFRDNQDGQSLVEILVGLAIGALLIGTATVGVIFVLKSSTTNQNLGAGSDITQGLLQSVQAFAAADWSGLYDLDHGASSTYFITASGTNLITAPGAEGVLGNDVTNGLVGHWGLDAGTGTVAYDLSGNGDNGTLVNNPVWQTGSSCKVGNCLEFNGSNTYITVNGSPALNTPTAVTVSAWVYPLSFGGGTYNRWLIMDNNWGGSNTSFRIFVNASGTVTFETYNGTSVVDANSVGFLKLNAWNFVVATYDSALGSDNQKIYINGTLDPGMATQSGDLAGNGQMFYVGGRGSNYDVLNGSLDDVRLYDRALSASEVQQLYNSQPFSSYFYVEGVCRTNDASSSIVGNPPCVGTYEDPLTQEVTAVTQWPMGQATDETVLSTYLTRYENFTLRQSDWSGGAGQTAPLTIPNNKYASGTNITGTSTYGSFQIQGLAP